MQLSHRIHQASASQTVKLDTVAKQLMAEGKPMINLTAGELDVETPDVVLEAAVEAVNGSNNHYTSPQGTSELRAAISQYVERQYALEYAAEQILVTNGVKQAMYSALQVLVNPGDEVLVLVPGWVSYIEQIKLAGGVPVLVETTPEGTVSTAAMEEAITKNTVGIIINSPANPTGVIVPEAILRAIAQLAESHDWWIISDEIYDRLVYTDEAILPMAQLYPARTLTVNGLSKAGAMTGWRVGFAYGPVEIISAMTKLQSHLSGNVNNVAQATAQAALQQVDTMIPQYVTMLAERRAYILEWVTQHQQLECITPQGAFYCFIDISAIQPNSQQFCEQLLTHHNVAIVPGVYFGREGYVRLSFANELSVLQQATSLIDTFITQQVS